MSNTIQLSYGTQTYSAPAKARETKRTGTQANSFLDLAARAIRQVQTGNVEATEATEAPSLETMLKAKYPNIHYHVFDASSGYWRTRNDYPHHLLYQDGDKAKETLENWQPTGANPFYASLRSAFCQHGKIPACQHDEQRWSNVVIIPL